jgi:DNA-binding NtrC family response regulator
MEKELFIITTNSKFGNSLKGQLPKGLCRASVLASFKALADELQVSSTCVAAVDIDTLEPDVQQIRALKRNYSNLVLLAFSERKFHPEYKDVLSNYFYACLSKPIDIDDLLYLIKDF